MSEGQLIIDYQETLKRNMALILENDKLQQRIDKAIELIKDRIEYIEMEELSWVEMPYEDYKEEYNKLLETLEGKEIEEIPQFKGTLEELNNLTLGEIIGDKNGII